MSEFYDGTKLLSLQDINGNKPEIYLCVTNRSGGKTTWFSRYLVKKFLQKDEKFCILYRFNYELDDVADKFFKDIKSLFFPKYNMTANKKGGGYYSELFLNDKPCGYAIALNQADNIKKNSHLFSDVQRIFVDEFQSETNHYCNDEIEKFISIHTSIARGQGQQSRYVPVYMCSNAVTLLNPYYNAFDIPERLREDTKFLKGTGWVMESGFVKGASEAQKNSAFNQAFANSQYMLYNTENVYLYDVKSLIEKPTGRSKYICSIKYKGEWYSLKQFPESRIIYCDRKYDESYPFRVVFDTLDHDETTTMIKSNPHLLISLRTIFMTGNMRFKDVKCKGVIMKMLSF